MKVENQRLIEVCEYLMYQKKEQSLASISNAVFGHKNYFTALKRQDTNPSQMIINYLVDKHNVNSDYIWRGEGEMIKVPATMTIYNPSSEERQEVGEGVDLSMYPAEVVEEIKAEVVEEIREEVRAEIAKSESVPLVSSKIANDTNVEDLQEFLKKKGDELEQIKPGDLVGNADTAERIRKTSMMPTFMPGDVVFVQFLEDKTNITDGHTYYFKMATKPTMIRKVKIEGDNLRLIAENPNFGDIITTFDEIVNVATIEGMFRSSFSNQYAEVESVRRKKDEQVDNLIEQNGKALQIIENLLSK